MLKSSTKKGQKVYAMYQLWSGNDLSDVYGRWSSDKRDAFAKCWHKCQSEHGRNFHIGSCNSYVFTVCWKYTDTTTGHECVCVVTKNNTYRVDLAV